MLELVQAAHADRRGQQDNPGRGHLFLDGLSPQGGESNAQHVPPTLAEIMITVTTQIVGADTIGVRLDEKMSAIWDRVKKVTDESGIKLQGIVKDGPLTGQPLNVRTGRLRRSITEKFTADSKQARSIVGTNVSYGRFWELGFKGNETVRAHTRRLRTLRVRGKNKGRRTGSLGSGGVVSVRTHTRRVDQDARPFLQPSTAAIAPYFRNRVLEALKGK